MVQGRRGHVARVNEGNRDKSNVRCWNMMDATSQEAFGILQLKLDIAWALVADPEYFTLAAKEV